MDPRARRLALLLALVLIGAWWWMRGEGEEGASPTHEAPHDETAIAEVDAAVALPPEPSAITTRVAAPSARAPAPSEGEIDPCGSGEDDPPVTRPSMSELLQLRVAELNDRMTATLRRSEASASLRDGWIAAQDPTREREGLALLARAPDRVDDGFDTYVAVAVVVAANTLHAGDAAHAVQLSEAAAHAAPTDALPLLLAGLAHEARGEHDLSRDRFVQAFAIDPEEPAIAYQVAWRTEHGADPRLSLAAFDAYLAAMPEDREMARRRARLAVRASTFDHGRVHAQRGLTVVGDASLSDERAAHLLEVVSAGLDRGATLLGVPRRDELAVFVYPTQLAMQRATCTQAWTGAAYDGALETDTDTLESPRGDLSLTHEAFHAAIHPAVPNVPTWLDEGLAQYASGEEGAAQLRSYELMIREHTWIPFASMNDAFLVIDDTQDAGLAYHQALAMVQWLVERRGERGIRDAARWLIDGGDPTRVLAEAAHGELDGEALLAFVARHVAATRAQGHASPR